MRPLRILTWHIHGSYLYYLSHVAAEFYVLSTPDRKAGYTGRYGHFPWGPNVHDMPVAELTGKQFDCILFQARNHYLEDQHQILSAAQQRLPKIYLEHDPPRESAFDTRHIADDPNVLLVHVTHFNRLMWNNGRSPTCVIPHGVVVPDNVHYSGTKERGIVVINNLARRGRRLGEDVYREMREHIPLDLIGMGSEESPGGIGEIQHNRLPEFMTSYRFFFNPIRYTSLGLAVCEAMMLGMPIVGLATTEMTTTIENGISGYIYNDTSKLIEVMHHLLLDAVAAQRLSQGARLAALERFNISRFVCEWERTFSLVSDKRVPSVS